MRSTLRDRRLESVRLCAELNGFGLDASPSLLDQVGGVVYCIDLVEGMTQNIKQTSSATAQVGG